MDLKGFEWIVWDEKVVWINGWMVRFEGIWGYWLWKFENDLIDVIDLFLFF